MNSDLRKCVEMRTTLSSGRMVIIMPDHITQSDLEDIKDWFEYVNGKIASLLYLPSADSTTKEGK